MSEKCPVYLGNNCVLKSLFTKHFNANIFGVELKQLDEKYQSNCDGLISKCSFAKEEVLQEEHKEEAQKQEVVEEVVEEEPIPSTHFVVATPSVQVAETLEVPKNFINYNISDAISKSIANKFEINPKQIDIILTGNNDDIEISFARIYLSGEDVARLSIGV